MSKRIFEALRKTHVNEAAGKWSKQKVQKFQSDNAEALKTLTSKYNLRAWEPTAAGGTGLGSSSEGTSFENNGRSININTYVTFQDKGEEKVEATLTLSFSVLDLSFSKVYPADKVDADNLIKGFEGQKKAFIAALG